MEATLWQHLETSLQRIFISLILAILIGVPIGMIMGLNTWINDLLDPLVEFYRPIPPLAYLPLVVIWLGIGESTKVALIFLAMLAPIIISTKQGMLLSNDNRIRSIRSLGAKNREVITEVILPSALPNILTGIRIGLGAGWSTLVAAELIAAQRGLGYMIQSASQFLVTDIVILGIVVIAIVALCIEVILRKIQTHLTPWYGKCT